MHSGLEPVLNHHALVYVLSLPGCKQNANTWASAAKNSKKKKKSNHTRCAALPWDSCKVQKPVWAGTQEAHFYGALVACPQLCTALRGKQRCLPLAWRSPFPPWKEKTERKKIPEVWPCNILDPWSMPSLLNTAKSLRRHGDTPH